MMPGGIDYSKWDNFEDSSSDEEESSNVRVTTLDGPSKVTIGGEQDGSVATIVPSSTSLRTTAVAVNSNEGSKFALEGKFEQKASSNNDSYSSWRECGAMVEIASKKSQRRLFWSQDRYSVLLRLELFKEEKVKAMELTGAVAYADRFCAVSSSKPTIQVLSTCNDMLLEGELPHAVHFAQDDDSIDWLIERSFKNERFLAITLYKAVPIQDVAIWWRRPLIGFDEIDVGVQSKKDPQSFQKAWDEAHEKFRERRQRN